MYTLDINYFKKQSITYFIASFSCLLFGLIYEYFSHNVYSNYMLFSWLIPFVFGTIVSILIYTLKAKKLPKSSSNNLYNASIATFTFGCIIKGVLDIYGTTNWKIIFYLIAGISLLIASVITYIISLKKQ